MNNTRAASLPIPIPVQRGWENLPAVALLTAAGLALRLARLGFQPLWWDEGYTVWFATQPPLEMIALTARDIHPPLYYGLLSVWIGLWGTHPLALRLFSALVGTLTIPLLYLATRTLMGSRVGLWAVGLLALSPIHVYYSQELRMYGLVALLSLGATFYASRLLGLVCDSDEATLPADGAKYLACMLAALYTQYYAALLPIGFTIYALWRWRRAPRRIAGWLAWQGAAALGYLPWVWYAAPQLIPYVSQKVVVEADRPLSLFVYWGRHLSAFAIGHLEGPIAAAWPLGLLPLAPIAWWLWYQWQAYTPGRELISFLLTSLVVSLSLGFLLNLRYPFFPERGERLLLLAAPALWLVAAHTLAELWQRHRRVALTTASLWAALTIVSLGVFYTFPRYAADDYRPLVAQIQRQSQPDDVIWCVFPWQVGYFRAYLQPPAPAARLLPTTTWGQELESAIDATLKEGRRLWLPEHLSLGGILETQIETYLLRRGDVYPTVNAWYGPNTRLTLFTPAAGPALAGPPGDRPARFGQGLLLHHSLLSPHIPRDEERPELADDPHRLRPQSDVLRIDLEWEVVGALPETLQVGLRLADAAGRTWSQRDSLPQGGSLPFSKHPAGQTLRDRHGLMIPPGVPPGRYTVWLKVYDVATGRALDLIRPDGRTQGVELALGEVDVWPADRPSDPQTLPIARRQTIDLSGGVRFLGYTVAEGPFEPGRVLPVHLFWQARRDLDQEYLAFVQLLGEDDRLLAAWEGPPAASFPTYQWQAGALVWQQVDLRLPAVIPDGRHRLIAGMFRVTDRSRLITDRRLVPPRRPQDFISLGTATIRNRPRDFTPPSPQYALDARVGSVARLVGYDLSTTTASPGEQITVTLYWQALASADAEYTVFVHLLDAAGRFRGQRDAPPGDGAYPTTGWIPDEYVTDLHTLTIPPDASSGVYTLQVGMYLPSTNARLPVRYASGAEVGDAIPLSQSPITVP